MKQILIVEDDSFLNKMLSYNLTADGYGVTSALNFRTAAEAVRQREFDLILLDVNLPDGSGFELCKLVKPNCPDAIVIFLTANDQESDQICFRCWNIISLQRKFTTMGGYSWISQSIPLH